MSNKRMEFLIGMMVLTVFVTIIVMTILFAPQRNIFRGSGGTRMTIVFDRAAGITNTSRVMKSGIEIGRVYKSELVDNQDKAEVRVSFTLDNGVEIYSNEYARINRTILGDAAIEFVKNPNYKGEVFAIKPDEIITGVPGGDLTATVSNIEGDLAKAIQSVNLAAREMNTFLANMNNFLGSPEELQRKKERLETTFTELNETLVTFKSLGGNLNAIVSDKEVQNNIRQTSKAVPEILSKVDAFLGNANLLADDFKTTMSKTDRTFDKVERNLDNLNDFTSALSEEGPEFLSSLNASGNDLRKMVGNISSLAEEFSTMMDNPQTPLGMIGDPEMGASIKSVVKNVETVTEKVQPILDDARVFSNKVAHKPSSLIWGKESYKGSPVLNSSEYGFQPYSPGGGVSSGLFRPDGKNNAPGLPLTNPDGSRRRVTWDPDSLDAYYALYPAGGSGSSPLAGLSSGLDRLKSRLCPKKGEDGYTLYDAATPEDYYGMSAVSDETQRGGVAGEWSGYSDTLGGEYPEWSEPDEMDGGVYRFSLSRAFRKLFPCKKKTAKAALAEPVVYDAVYRPTSDDSGCGLSDCQVEGGCGGSGPLGGEGSVGDEDSAASVSGFSDPGAWSLPTESIPQNVGGNEFRLENGTLPSPGYPEAAKNSVSASGGKTSRYQTVSRPSVTPNLQDEANRNDVPLGPPARNFIDDGLPIQLPKKNSGSL